jgi:hypothetical protein
MTQPTTRRFSLILVTLVVLCAVPEGASAILITRNFSFTGSGFGPQAPIDPVFGSFTVSFETTTQNFGSVSSFTSNLNFPGPYGYTFTPVPPPGLSSLCVGNGSDASGCSAVAGHNNVTVSIFNPETPNPIPQEVIYSTDIVDHTGLFFSSTLTVSFTEPVPEPSTLMLLGISVLSLLGYCWMRPIQVSVGRQACKLKPFAHSRAGS